MGKKYFQKDEAARPYVVMPQVIRTPYKIFRITSMALLLCIVNSSLATAFETTKASGLVLEKEQTNSSSHTPLASPYSRKDERLSPCLTFLSRTSVAPKQDVGTGNNRQFAGDAAVPAALGLFFGVRIVLGPKEVIPASQRRIQIGPELRGASDRGGSYALAIAAYRKCQKEEFLKSR